MAQAAKRRFPPAPGLLGWLGVGLTSVGGLLEVAAILLLGWLAISRNSGLILPAIGTFVLSVGFIGSAAYVWSTANKRVGILRQSSLTEDQRREMRSGLSIILITDVCIVAGFLAVALAVHGSMIGRFCLACVPLVIGGIPAYYGLVRMHKASNRPAPRLLGLSQRASALLYISLAVIAAIGLLFTGLYLLAR